MIAEKIKALREGAGTTQAELARALGVTRSGVNAWEMGISTPSTQYVVELAEFFNVSSDYLLGIEKTASLSLEGLAEADAQMVHLLAEHLRRRAAERGGE